MGSMWCQNKVNNVSVVVKRKQQKCGGGKAIEMWKQKREERK